MNNFLGVAAVNKQSVIDTLEKRIYDYQCSRSQLRRFHCKRKLEQALEKWYKFKRWFGFRKPRMKDIVYHYYNVPDPYLTHAEEISYLYMESEDECRSIIAAAKASTSSDIYLSIEVIDKYGIK